MSDPQEPGRPVDPFELALQMAEPDDEPLTESERIALEAADTRRQRGVRPVSHEDLLKQLGFTGSVLPGVK